MKIEYNGCVDNVNFDQTDYAASILINVDRKHFLINSTVWSRDQFTFLIGDGVQDYGEVTFYYDSEEDKEIFSRTRFYLEEKDLIWVLLPKPEVYI